MVDHPIQPVDGEDVLTDLDDLSIEIKSRTCESCGKGQIKQLLHW